MWLPSPCLAIDAGPIDVIAISSSLSRSLSPSSLLHPTSSRSQWAVMLFVPIVPLSSLCLLPPRRSPSTLLHPTSSCSQRQLLWWWWWWPSSSSSSPSLSLSLSLSCHCCRHLPAPHHPCPHCSPCPHRMQCVAGAVVAAVGSRRPVLPSLSPCCCSSHGPCPCRLSITAVATGAGSLGHYLFRGSDIAGIRGRG